MQYFARQPQPLTDECLSELLSQLPEWRRQRALAFKHAEGRWQSAQSYLLLREALRREFGVDTDEEFSYGEHGKPMLSSYPHIFFNISHCRGVVMCVVSDVEVGCDVEPTGRKVTPVLMKHCLNESEQQSVEAAADPSEAFLRLWTQKEALVKKTGKGLATDIPSLLTTPEAKASKFQTEKDEALGVVWSVVKKG